MKFLKMMVINPVLHCQEQGGEKNISVLHEVSFGFCSHWVTAGHLLRWGQMSVLHGHPSKYRFISLNENL